MSAHDQPELRAEEQRSLPHRSDRVNEPPNEKEFRKGYQSMAENFRAVMVACLEEAEDNKQRQEMLMLLVDTSREFLKRRSAITGAGFGCPNGFNECPDGSCVPKGHPCESERLLGLL